MTRRGFRSGSAKKTGSKPSDGQASARHRGRPRRPPLFRPSSARVLDPDARACRGVRIPAPPRIRHTHSVRPDNRSQHFSPDGMPFPLDPADRIGEKAGVPSGSLDLPGPTGRSAPSSSALRSGFPNTGPRPRRTRERSRPIAPTGPVAPAHMTGARDRRCAGDPARREGGQSLSGQPFPAADCRSGICRVQVSVKVRLDRRPDGVGSGESVPVNPSGQRLATAANP